MRFLMLITVALISILSSASAANINRLVGKHYSRAELEKAIGRGGFANVEHAGTAFYMTSGKVGDTQVLYVVRTDKRDAKGKGTRYSITDIREYPKLANNERLATVCAGMDGTIGIVRALDPHNAAGEVVRLITIDPKGRFKDLPPDGADCRNENDGA